MTKTLKVAFVYPPFGPPNLANLGIAILAAGLQQRGFETRTFYWNYRLLDLFPGAGLDEQGLQIEGLDQRQLRPAIRDVARLEGISGAPRSSKQGWTDVATLTAHGIPAVNFGPGEVEQAHKVGESVALANLDESFRVLVEFLTT